MIEEAEDEGLWRFVPLWACYAFLAMAMVIRRKAMLIGGLIGFWLASVALIATAWFDWWDAARTIVRSMSIWVWMFPLAALSWVMLCLFWCALNSREAHE